MKKNIILSVLFAMLAVSSSFGEVGLKLLTVEMGARPAGMGGAFTSVSGDPISAAYNPAATWGIKTVSGSFGYNTHWENTQLETGYLSLGKESIVFTAGVQYGGVSDIEGRQNPTADYYSFAAHDINLKLGAAFELDKKSYLGIAVGMMYEKIKENDGMAFNFDLGLLVEATPDIMVGLAVLNFGSTIKLVDEPYDLPTTYRGGASYTYGPSLTSADIVYLDSDIYFHLGEEFKLTDEFILRAGYRVGYDSRDFSAGFGFSKRNFRIDYSFMPYKNELNDSHLFNLTFSI